MATLKEQDFYHFNISGADDNLNIVVNGDLEIHVSESVDGGYNLSFSKAIHGFWISPKSLKQEEE